VDGQIWAGAAAVESGVAARAAWDREPITRYAYHNRCLEARPRQIKTALAEGHGRLESNTLLGTAAPLGDTPLLVLASAQSIDHLPFWRDAQQIMVALSSNSRLVVVRSGHSIHFEQPAIVVEGIREVVDAARGGQPLKQ